MNFVATICAGLGGCILLAKGLDKWIERGMPRAQITEDADDVGYFLDGPQGTGPAVALRSLPSDDLPTCPDYIPEWMMPHA
jgi:hypothetical protein